MSAFQTHMQAEVRVPQEGFTLDALKAHLKDSKIPLNARLTPANVKVDLDPDSVHEVDVRTEIAFIAEWRS